MFVPVPFFQRTSLSVPSMSQPKSDHSNTTLQGDAAISDDGDLLADLEARQDDVIERLDALEKQLIEILSGLGVTLESDEDETADCDLDEIDSPNADASPFGKAA